MLEALKQASCVVGLKQSKKAVKDGAAARVYVARDAEHRVIAPVLELCAASGVEVVEADTMKELGAACGIDVGAAVVAVLHSK